MRHFYLLSLLIIANAAPKDITISKDGLKIYTNQASSFADKVFIKNNSTDTIGLDSAHVLLAELDSSGMGKYFYQEKRFEAHWTENANRADFGWYLNEIEHDTYKLVKKYFYPNNAIPLRCSPGDSCDLDRLEIGIYLVSAHYPVYPKYLSGDLQLFFSNKQAITIKLYSDDLRTSIISRHARTHKNHLLIHDQYFSLHGKSFDNAHANAPTICIVAKKNQGTQSILKKIIAPHKNNPIQ